MNKRVMTEGPSSEAKVHSNHRQLRRRVAAVALVAGATVGGLSLANPAQAQPRDNGSDHRDDRDNGRGRRWVIYARYRRMDQCRRSGNYVVRHSHYDDYRCVRYGRTYFLYVR